MSYNLGHGRVQKSAKYFTVHVFDPNYDASMESSSGSDISFGATDVFMNKGQSELKRAMDLATRQRRKKKKKSVTPATVVKAVNDTVRGLMKPNSALESKFLQKVGDFLADASVASEAEKTEAALLADVRERIRKINRLCTAEKNCWEAVGQIFLLLDERWKQTGRTGVPRSARFLLETGVFLSEGRALLDDLAGLAAKEEEVLVELLSAKKGRATTVKPGTPRTSGTPCTIESVNSSVVYQDPPIGTRITIRKAASEPRSKPKSSVLNRNRAASASRTHQRNSPRAPRGMGSDVLRKAKELQARLDRVHTRANNLISYTQDTLDMLDRRYKRKSK